MAGFTRSFASTDVAQPPTDPTSRMTADAHALGALYKGRKFTKEFPPNGEFQGVVKSIWESEEEEGKFYARVYYPADGDREDILVSELKELLNKPKAPGAKREGRGKKRAAPSTEGVTGEKKKKGGELKAEKKKVGAAAAASSAAAVIELDDADEPAQPGEIEEGRQGDEGSVGTVGPDGHKETEGEEEEQQDEDSQKQPEVAPETQGKTGGATVQGICEEGGEGMDEEERVEAIGGSAEVMAEEGGGDKGGQKGGRKVKGEDGVGAAEGRAVDEDVEAMVEGPKKRKRAAEKEEEQHETEQGDGEEGGEEGGQAKKNEELLEISDNDVPSFTLRKRGGDVERDHQGCKRDEKKKAKREKHGSRAAHAVLDADAAAAGPEEEMDEKPKSRKHASKQQQQQPEKKDKANKQDKTGKKAAKKKARHESDLDIYAGRKLKEVKQELEGRTLVKLFGDEYYRGKITEIWQDDKGSFMAHVVYEDGDEEDEAAAVTIKLLQ